MHYRHYSRSISAIVGLALMVAAAGCGGGGGGGSTQQPQTPKTGLVVGSASGPIYDELVSAYHLSPGNGSESPEAFGLVIYDGQSLTPEEIASLPSTDSFLNAGKILIVLNPSLDDLKALEGELGAAALVDTPAVAVFKTFLGKDGLQAATVIEFPTTIDEPIPSGDGSSASLSAVASANASNDEETIRAQAGQWRKRYEQIYVDTSRSKDSVKNVASDQLAAAAVDDGSSSSSPAAAASPAGDLTTWLALPSNSELAPTSPFWTVRQFRERRDVTLSVRSKIFLDPVNYQRVPSDGRTPEFRGLCPFLFRSPQWSLNPVTANETASITNIVNRLLQPTSGSNGPTFNHNILVRQVIDSSPPATLPDPTIGTVTVNWCAAQIHENGFWSCSSGNPFCADFDQTFPVQSLIGFNAQVVSNLAWDPATAALLNAGGLRPLAANNVSTVSTSETQKLGVDFSIQGSIDAELIPPHIGLGVGSPNVNLDWTWSQTKNINIKDWATQPNKEGAVAIHTLFAKGGPDNLDNLNTFLLPGNPNPGNGVLSLDPSQLTDLQRSNIESRTETTWTTSDGILLPPTKASMTSTTTFTYGEVLTALSAIKGIDPGPLPYGAVHVFPVPTTFEFDFAQPVLQAPKPATWTLNADLKTPPNTQGYFTVDGTVTLNQPNILDTTILLGGEIYNFGNTQPAPTVIKNLPTQITIPAGEPSANFEFLARRIGSPYNLRVWAFQAQGQQVAFPLTVPAK